MKLAFIVNNLESGGLTNLLCNIANEFKNNGNNISFIVTEKKGDMFEFVKKNHSIKFFDIWLHNSFENYLSSMIEFINAENFDAVYLNNAKYGQLIAPYLNSFIISVLHENNEVGLNRCIVNNSFIDKYIAISEGTFNNLKNKVAEQKISLIYNGICLREDDDNVKSFKRNNHLVYVGRLSDKDKGIFLLPAILEELIPLDPKIKLFVLGDGPDYLQLYQMFKEKGTIKYVEFTGMVNSETVNKYLQKSKILIFPSKFEGFGLSIIEAMNNKCIPIASYIEGVTNKIIDDGINGYLIKNRDSKEYANKIKSVLYAEEDLFFEMSENAYLKSKNFNINKTAKNWLNQIGKKENKKKEWNFYLDINNIVDSYKNTFVPTSRDKKCNLLINILNRKMEIFPIENKKIVIFGTLETAYFIFSNLSKQNNIIAFVDNYSRDKNMLDIPIWSTEELLEKTNLFDVIVLSLDGNSEGLQKELETKTGKKVVSWQYYIK